MNSLKSRLQPQMSSMPQVTTTHIPTTHAQTAVTAPIVAEVDTTPALIGSALSGTLVGQYFSE